MSQESDLHDSSELFNELRRLCDVNPSRERSAQAWQAFGRAYGTQDWPVLADLAMEHGLIRHCEEESHGAELDGEHRHRVWVNPVDGVEMVWIPEGPFFVGPKKAKRVARSAGFSLARHPVTNSQFARFLEETSYTPPAMHPEQESFLSHWILGKVPSGLEKHPVVWVSYVDALAYCDWAGVTLPTEWLWEKAARGPDGPPFPWGEMSPMPGYNERPTLANVRTNGTCPVGSFPRTRSAYGCEDMVGNISEWCRRIEDDDYGLIPDQRPDIRIPAPDVERIHAAVRGSCYLRWSRERMPAWHRRRLSVTRRNRWVGFRPACFLPFFPA